METIIKKPNLYDLLYQDVKEDIAMYIKILDGHRDILEFGAGTGRVSIPLAVAGHYIDAVDIEINMIKFLSNRINNKSELLKRIKPILGNMCKYYSKREFDAVIIPLTSFNYLLTEEEQIQCLRSVKINLKDSGFAIIELLSKNTYDDIDLDDNFRFVKRIDLGCGQHYDYYRNTSLDMNTRKITQKRMFKLYIKGQLVNVENYIWENRFVTIDDFKYLSSIVGLYVEEIYGNCNLEKHDEKSEDVFVKVRRKII